MKLKLVAVAIAALAPVVTMLGYNEYAVRSQRNDELRAQATQAARQASSEVERIIEGLHSLLIAVRSMPSVINLDKRECDNALKSVASAVPNIRMIFVLDLDGRMVCGSQEAPPSVSFADREYFKQALSDNGFVVGTFTKSRMSNAPVLPVAMPVEENGAVKAVVVSGVRLDWLQNRISERGVSPGNAVTVADGGGTILARVPLPERFVGTVIPDDFQKLVHAKEPGVIEVTSQDGTRRILGYRPISPGGNPLYVSAGFSKSEAFAPIDRSTYVNIVAIVGGALFSFLAALFVGNRFLLSPIATIAAVMARWRSGEVSVRTGMARSDEIHSMGADLDTLLDELDCRRQQNEAAVEERALLVRELAHRVKNGFALVQAIARQTFARTDQERYASFSQRLSALAGTYNLILSREGEASSARTVLQAALQAHASEADRIRLNGPEITLPADLALPMSLVVHELATNATKYGSLSNEDGRVEITWNVAGGRVALVWTEIGGPAVAAPTRKGFGSVLIERAFPGASRAVSKSDFLLEGLRFEISFALPEHSESAGVAVD